MKAIVVNEPGGSDKLKLTEINVPTFSSNEVLVEVHVAGINFIDIYIRTGLYPTTYPYVPGKEGSGIVVEVGEKVKAFKKGDRVAFSYAGTGTYAEYVAISSEQIVPLPDGVSYEVGAAVMLQGLTAYFLSHLTYPVKEGNEVLIHAGAGGVGLLLIQMVKQLGGIVYTTISNETKEKMVQTFGADYSINYTSHSFLDFIVSKTNGKGVNVVYDSVGKTTFMDSLKCLRPRGMLVSYGQSSGAIPPFNIKELASKSLFLTRPSLFDYTSSSLSLKEMAKAVFEMILNKNLVVSIGQQYALGQVKEAHDNLEDRKTIGKSILTIR